MWLFLTSGLSINRMVNLKRAQYGKVDLDYVLDSVYFVFCNQLFTAWIVNSKMNMAGTDIDNAWSRLHSLPSE
jgi:hypothetical protein